VYFYANKQLIQLIFLFGGLANQCHVDLVLKVCFPILMIVVYPGVKKRHLQLLN